MMYRSPEINQQGVQDLAQILDVQRMGGHDRTSSESQGRIGGIVGNDRIRHLHPSNDPTECNTR